MIALGPNAWVEAYPSLPSSDTTTTLGFQREWWRGVRFFNQDGLVYEVASATTSSPPGTLARLLAATVHNPSIEVSYTYRSTGPYALDDLKAGLQAAIDADDDILTQWHDASDLTALLGKATTFEQVAAVLTLAGTDGDAT